MGMGKCENLNDAAHYQVGSEIFTKYIKQALKDKTVLLVTHGIQVRSPIWQSDIFIDHSAI